MIGLFKILAHCPLKSRVDAFKQIEMIYKDKGDKYDKFLKYFKKNWLQHSFLEGLFDAYRNNSDVNFIRTNNPCEIFNQYLGKVFYIIIILTSLGQVFEYAKPRAGYFISKLKDIEYQFRGKYLEKCKGGRKKSKSNIEKNPLENMTLPYEHLIENCAKLFEEAKFDLDVLKKNELFMDTIKDLAGKFIDLIGFEHLTSQREAENVENQLCIDLNEHITIEEDLSADLEQYSDISDGEEDEIIVASKKKVNIIKR